MKNPPELKKRKINTNTGNGFNFNCVLYMTLRENWFRMDKKDWYEKLYVSESGNRASTLKELKAMEN